VRIGVVELKAICKSPGGNGRCRQREHVVKNIGKLARVSPRFASRFLQVAGAV